MNSMNSWASRIALAVAGFVVAHIGVGLLVERYLPHQSILNMAIIAFAQGAFSLTVAFVILTWQATVLWREGKLLYDHGLAIGKGVGGRRRVKRSVLTFLRPRLYEHFKETQRLFADGLPITKTQLGDLIAAAFSSGSGAYIGTDKNVPSEFFRLYPFYLDRQTKGRDPSGDVRFVLAKPQELQDDYAANPTDFRTFVNRHETNGIKLFQVDPERAARTHASIQLAADEMGVYGKDYVVFFSHSTNEHFLISIRLLEQPLRQGSPDKLRAAVEAYLTSLNADARQMTFGNGGRLVFRERENEEKNRELRTMIQEFE